MKLDIKTKRAIIQLSLKGESSRSIAKTLGIGKTTVNNHLKADLKADRDGGSPKQKKKTVRYVRDAPTVTPDTTSTPAEKMVTDEYVRNALAAELARQLPALVEREVKSVIQKTGRMLVADEVKWQLSNKYTFASWDEFVKQLTDIMLRKMSFSSRITRDFNAVDIAYSLDFNGRNISSRS